MRQIETRRASAVAATQQLSPPPAAAAATKPPCDPRVHDCRWWPYSSSGDFGAHTAMVVIILLCAFICALALNAAVRCFLRNTTRRRPPSGSQRVVQERKTSSEMVYSSSSGMMMKLNDCSICLSEFAEGERVRVLERCKHGFHARCIDTWLSGHSSCPTCRATCFVLPPPPLPPPLPQNSSNSGAGERVDDREIGGVVVDVDVDGGPPRTGYGDVIN